jgi:hypothetical protein
VDVKALARQEGDALPLPVLEDVFETQGEILLHLGVLGAGDIASLREEFLHPSDRSTAAMSFPSIGLILVSSSYGDSIDVLVHELGHLVSAEQGYERTAHDSYSLARTGELDPSWIDLDALLASWLAEEAEAEMTGRIAIAFNSGGATAVERLWRAEIQEEHPDVTGPARIHISKEETIELAPGEGYFFKKSIVQDLIKFAYGGSMRLVRARHKSGESLEETLQRMWSGFSYMTREVLYPYDPVSVSRLAATARQGSIEAVGATRIGSLLVREMLERRGHLSRTRASKIARNMEDDIVLKVPEGGVIWIIQWEDEHVANDFVDAYQPLDPVARIGTRGSVTSITWGTVPDSEEIVARFVGK